MTVLRMDHVGIVVDDLQAAIDFFADIGLEQKGQGTVAGESVDRVVALEGVRSDIVFMQTPDGHAQVELVKFQSPRYEGGAEHAPSNAPGIRHLTFAVDDIDAVLARLQARGVELVGELIRYENSYRLCYVRGPAGMIVELGEPIG